MEVVLILWVGAGILGALYPETLVPPFVGLVTGGAWLLVGLVLFAILLVRLIRNPHPVWSWVRALTVPILLLMLVTWSSSLARIGRELWFVLERSSLEDMVTDIRANGCRSSKCDERGVVIDDSRDVRVAFPYGGGLLDNWQAFVYDPTGKVGTATGERWNDPGYQATKKLFGGDLVVCEIIRESWYFCWFT